MVFCTQFQATSKRSTYQLSIVKNKSPSFCNISSCTRVHASRALSIINTEETYGLLEECNEQKLRKSEEQTLIDEVQLDIIPNCTKTFMDVDQELQRRRKIGLANKGRVPWNKGRKHSGETRERISQRTKEAMMDPKVRKKMSECPRALSDQTKAKIGSSLRQLWGERLKWKRSREKFFLSWAGSIAEAAKKGGSDQQELPWDSYDKMKKEIDLQQHLWASNRVKTKLKPAQANTGKMRRLAEKGEEHEQKANARRKIKGKTCRKSNEGRKELAIAEGLTLKQRLRKIHKKKSSTNDQITCEDQRSWEKLDLEIIKREHSRKEISLADQIRAAKAKRVEVLARESFPTSSPYCSSREESAA